MQGYSASAERTTEHAADSSAERPAHQFPDDESGRIVSAYDHPGDGGVEPLSDDDDSDADVELRYWFAHVERIFRKPLWKDLRPCNAKRPWLLLSEVASLRELAFFRSQHRSLKWQLPSSHEEAATAHERYTSSAVQPASASTAAPLLSAIPSEALLAIIGYVGAHNLGIIWECSACDPYWYDWYCDKCQLRINYSTWSNTRHFGYCNLPSRNDYMVNCDNFCGCCRSKSDGSGCEACDHLRDLKRTCHAMLDFLKAYSGT